MPAVLLGPAGLTLLGKVLVVVGNIVLSAGISAGLSKLLGKPKLGAGGPDRSITIRSTIQPRSLIYGEVRTGGFMAFIAANGTYNEQLVYVIALAGHQCEEISHIWLDGLGIPSSSIDSGTGAVTGFNIGGIQKLYIWKHLGTHNQTADSFLNGQFAEWTSDHRGNGIPYIVVAMISDDDAFPMGAPSNTFAMVKGRRLYDPRLDSTNGGSGSHRYTDATTWAWSNNEALCRRDYITGGSRTYSTATPDNRLGLAESNSRIDDAVVMASANICDEQVLIPPASPTTEQSRYTCDVELSCGSTHRENLDILEACSIGNTAIVGGKIRINVGAYNTPAVTITDDDVHGPMTINTHNVGEDTYNNIIPEFYDDAQNYQLTPGPARTQSTYVTDDGQLLSRTIELHGVRDSYRAQRIANVHLEMTRQQTTVIFEALSPKAINIVQNELFFATLSEFGWVEQAIRCEKFKFMPANGMVRIEGRLESSSVWDDLDVADYETPGATGSEDAQTELPVEPNALTTTGFPTYIKVEVGFAERPPAGTIISIWRHTSSSPFSSAVRVDHAADRFVFYVGIRDTDDYYFWATARLNGQESTNYPATTGVVGAADTVRTSDIEPGAVISTPVTHSPSDGNQVFAADTAPLIEDAGLDGFATYTAIVDTEAIVSWMAQARISNTTSGAATGEARLAVRIFVDGVEVFSRHMILETFTGTEYALLSGSVPINVPVGDDIDVYLQVYRNFTTSGAFPAQTIYWRAANLSITPTMR